MKKVQIEFDELPFPALERFGLTREMIEDLPMRVLDDICNGRHSRASRACHGRAWRANREPQPLCLYPHGQRSGGCGLLSGTEILSVGTV